MESCPVEALATCPLFIGAEEDACCKDALEALDEAAIVNAVLWKLQELEYWAAL